MCNLRPALPLEELHTERLEDEKKRVAEAIVRDYFDDLTSARAQIITFLSASADLGLPLTYQDVGNIVGLSKPRICAIVQQYAKWGTEAGSPGRPPLLSPEQLQYLYSLVVQRYQDHSSIPVAELALILCNQFDICITTESLRHIIRTLPGMRTCLGIRMEEERVNCDPVLIDRWFDDLSRVVSLGIPPAFISNVDEVGFGGTEPDRDVIVVVPSSHKCPTVPIANCLKAKHATMIGAITADGGTIKPLLVVQRKTVDMELRLAGYTPDRIRFSKSETGFITREIFCEWLRDCYLPDLLQKRQSYQYEGPALLIMDGCTCHTGGGIEEMLAMQNVCAKLLPAHSSDQVQFLDLGIFAVQKWRYTQVQTHSDLSTQSKQVMRVYNSWHMSTTPSNVISAFERGGLIREWDALTDKIIAKVDRRYAGKVRHFQQDPDFTIQHRDRRRVQL